MIALEVEVIIELTRCTLGDDVQRRFIVPMIIFFLPFWTVSRIFRIFGFEIFSQATLHLVIWKNYALSAKRWNYWNNISDADDEVSGEKPLSDEPRRYC